MKKKGVILLLAVVLIAVAVAAVVWTYSRTVVLGEEYPFLTRGRLNENVILAWSEEKYNMSAVMGDFAPILRDARVTKGIKTNQGPDVGLLLRLRDNEGDNTVYSIEVGQDGTVTVTSLDTGGGRTFWKDKDGGLFDKLYQCYLENGGEELLN